MSDFDGKVAIVTGGGSGLGEAISKELAAKGARVIVSDINLAGAERVTQEIKDAGGTASAIEQDTAQPADSEKVVRHAVDTYGGLQLAVNNAGIGGPPAPAGETDLEAWDKVISINLNGVLYGMRYQIPAMLAAGAERCAIVNMASIHGMVAALGNGAYTAAKHGVVGITRNAAADTAHRACGSTVSVPATSRPRCCRPARGVPCRARPAASARPSRAARGGLAPRVLPAVGGGVVHHRRLLPHRRRIHHRLGSTRLRRAGRPAVRGSPSAHRAARATPRSPGTLF